MPDDSLYTVTELAAALGISARSIRFYETKGLLEPRRVGTTRVYDHRDRARLQLILRGKQLGFTLADIGDYLALYHADSRHAEQQRHLLGKVRARIGLLERQREALDQSLAELRQIEREAVAYLEAQGGARSGRAKADKAAKRRQRGTRA
ncbi:MAG TPA: MerR family DNA-binding transcriptional regulator [Gammaproteobacteria bacterium]